MKYLVKWKSGREEIIDVPTKKNSTEKTKKGEELLKKYQSVETVIGVRRYEPSFDGGAEQ